MKIIAIDVDGVVAALETAWLSRYNRDYNDTMTKEDWTDWDVHKLVKPECGIKIYEYIEDPTIYDEVPPIEGALDGINWFRQAYFRVIYVTNSTLGASGAKYNWLQKYNFIDRLDDYIECKDKFLIRADFIVDDMPKNCWDFSGKAILYNQPWNVNENWPGFRLTSWKEFNKR